ncbi:hypothetical protein GCM10029964_054770 [Kibdelosporangium lantanae]
MLAGSGGMVSVALPVESVRERCAAWADRLSVAAVNGPESVVVSGEVAALAEFQAACATDGVRARQIPVDYASHSPQVERIRDVVLALLEPITPRPAEIPFYSTLTGERLDTTAMGAEYWYRNLRETVLFEQVTRALLADGYDAFVETSPHPVLTAAVQQTVDATESTAVVLGTLRRDEGDMRRVLTSMAEADVSGLRITWPAAVTGGRLTDLPTYPFEHRRFWLEAGSVRPVATTASWQYGIEWRPLPVTGRADLGRVLLVVPADPELRTYADRVGAALGARDVVEHVDARLLSDVDHVVALLPLDERPDQDRPAVPVGYAATLALLRTMVDSGTTATLWCVTRGAVPAAGPVTHPKQALVWGLGRVAGLEQPACWGGVVDLPVDLDDDSLRHLRAVLADPAGEDQVAVRPAGGYGRRVTRPSRSAATPGARPGRFSSPVEPARSARTPPGGSRRRALTGSSCSAAGDRTRRARPNWWPNCPVWTCRWSRATSPTARHSPRSSRPPGRWTRSSTRPRPSTTA